MFDKLPPIPAAPAFRTMQQRIDELTRQLARMVPGSPGHRLATNTLLLLRDSMALLAETHGMLDRLKTADSPERTRGRHADTPVGIRPPS